MNGIVYVSDVDGPGQGTSWGFDGVSSAIVPSDDFISSDISAPAMTASSVFVTATPTLGLATVQVSSTLRYRRPSRRRRPGRRSSAFSTRHQSSILISDRWRTRIVDLWAPGCVPQSIGQRMSDPASELPGFTYGAECERRDQCRHLRAVLVWQRSGVTVPFARRYRWSAVVSFAEIDAMATARTSPASRQGTDAQLLRHVYRCRAAGRSGDRQERL